MDITRRQSLTGLAGILAAGVAPAAVVRSMLGARGVAMGGGGKPYDYELEWIQAGNNTSERFWVDTGVFSKGSALGTKIKCANIAPYSDRWAFGRYDGVNARDYIIGQHSGGWKWFIFGDRIALSSSYDSSPHEISVNINNKCTFDGVQVFEGTKTISEASGSNLTLGLFSLSDSINIANAVTRLYYLQMFRDGQMIRNYVPCVKNGVPCLYESVLKEFKYNERVGMGEFVAGPRV